MVLMDGIILVRNMAGASSLKTKREQSSTFYPAMATLKWHLFSDKKLMMKSCKVTFQKLLKQTYRKQRSTPKVAVYKSI